MGDFSHLRLVPPSVANIPIDWTRVPEASKEELLRYAYDWKKKVERPLPATIADLAQFFDKSKFFGYFSPSLCTLVMDISEFGLKAPRKHSAQVVGPRIYMKYLEQVWYLLFTPGTRDCIMGFSHDIIRKDYKRDEKNVEDEGDKDDKDDKEMEDEQDKEEERNGEDEGDKDDEEMEDEQDNGGNVDDEDEEDEEEDEEDEPEDPGAADEVVLAQEFDVILEREVLNGRGLSFLVKLTKKLGGWQATTLEDSLELAQYAEAMLTLPTSHPAVSKLFASIFSRPRY